MQVAILGTGKMGGSIAKRLHAAGHELTLWNRTRSRAEALGLGRVVATPAEAVRGAEVVISILTDATAVRGAYLGGNGAASAARDQVFIEMSTAGPDVVREVKPAVERSGAKFIGCPVMGSTTAMEAGKGILFAAGDDAAITRARPVLEALGEVRRMKDAESAAKYKLVANTALTTVSAMAAELVAAGAAAGLDKEAVFDLLTRFAPTITMRRAGFVEHKYEPVTFALRDADKDLHLATEVYHRAGAYTPITDTVRDLYDRAVPTSGALEMSAIMTVYEKEAAGRKT